MLLSDTEIQILPDFIANQIAAGEVVQRPESVVKELVENSLDAGATHITVIVRGAGKQLLHIVDNGKGMSAADLALAPKRHATSKIKTAADLERIMTLGFRGEALASIASVAQLEIRSRRASGTNNDEFGYKLLSEPLQEPRIEPCAMEVGTQVFVRNLFYNVPARRKFLRSDLTEFRHIADTMTRFALSRPSVRFTLYDDDALVYDLAPTTLKQRITDTLGSRFAESLLPVEYTDEIHSAHLHIWGFVGQPQFAKKSKTGQFFFLNGRTITSKQLSHAVMNAFEHLLDQSSYPPFIIFLEIDPERVDINIHPQKHEVKFDDDRTMYSAVRRAVASALEAHSLVPHLSFRHTANADNAFAQTSHKSPTRERMSLYAGRAEEREQHAFANIATGEILTSTQRSAPAEPAPPRAPHPKDGYARGLFPHEQSAFEALFGAEPSTNAGAQTAYSKARESSNHADVSSFRGTAQDVPHSSSEMEKAAAHHPATGQKFYWQLHKKYILSPSPQGFMIIDQHAAHERVLYERALSAMNTGFRYGQELLFPVMMESTASESALVEELHEDLTALGFELHLHSAQKIEIRAVPADVRTGREEDALRELLEQYREYHEVRHTNARDNLAASFGCRSAIRAGDLLSLQEMRSLMDDLYATTMPFACPHGRPIILEISLEELDRRFGRSS